MNSTNYLISLVDQEEEDLMAPTLVTGKFLQQSDIKKQQNRLLIPIADVRDRLVSLLSLDELRDANLLCLMTKKRKRYDKRRSRSGTDGGDRRRRKQTEVGREHRGLAVRLIAGGREIGMTLTQWDGTLGAVLKGGAGWKTVVAEQKLQERDYVELSAFRRSRSAAAVEKPGETGELCFLLRKKKYVKSSDGTATAAEPAVPEARQQVMSILNRSGPVDLSISLSLPAYSALRNGPKAVLKILIVKTEEEIVYDENGLNLELTLRQPGSARARDLN